MGDLGGLLSFSKRRQVFSIWVVGNSFSGGALAYYLELACVSYDLSRNKLKEKLQTEQLRDLTFGLGPGWDSFVIENYKNIITKFLKNVFKVYFRRREIYNNLHFSPSGLGLRDRQGVVRNTRTKTNCILLKFLYFASNWIIISAHRAKERKFMVIFRTLFLCCFLFPQLRNVKTQLPLLLQYFNLFVLFEFFDKIKFHLRWNCCYNKICDSKT